MGTTFQTYIDFAILKSSPAKAIIKAIQKENESHKDWLLAHFAHAAAKYIKPKTLNSGRTATKPRSFT